jgi:UDP-N-acetylglucosamine acyltransferase
MTQPLVHPTAIIEPGAYLADDVRVGPYCHISSGAVLNKGVKIHGHVILQGNVIIGAACEVFPFVCLGTPPQFIKDSYDFNSQIIIGEKVIIREHVTINPGTPKWGNKTTIGNNCFLMTGAHIGHDCHIGDHVILTNNVAIGGHCVIGDYVIIGGLSGIHQFVRIGDHAFVGGLSGVENDIIPYGSAFGNRATLKGLNLVGLKRRGFKRDTIDELRFAYRLLFADEGTFGERIKFVSEKYSENPLINNIVEFIQKDNARSICMPQTKSV